MNATYTVYRTDPFAALHAAYALYGGATGTPNPANAPA
jgi:hypothetical protein